MGLYLRGRGGDFKKHIAVFIGILECAVVRGDPWRGERRRLEGAPKSGSKQQSRVTRSVLNIYIYIYIDIYFFQFKIITEVDYAFEAMHAMFLVIEIAFVGSNLFGRRGNSFHCVTGYPCSRLACRARALRNNLTIARSVVSAKEVQLSNDLLFSFIGGLFWQFKLLKRIKFHLIPTQTFLILRSARSFALIGSPFESLFSGKFAPKEKSLGEKYSI